MCQTQTKYRKNIFFSYVANQLESKHWFFVSGKELKPQRPRAKQN